MIAPKSSFLIAGLLVLASCAVDLNQSPPEISYYDAGGNRFTAEETPPPPRPEADIDPAPGPEYVWIGGYWARQGPVWRWVDGRWVMRPGAEWVPEHWECRPGGAVRVSGFWKS